MGAIAPSAPAGDVIILRKNGVIEAVSPELADSWGCPIEAVIGSPLTRWVLPNYVKHVTAAVDRLISTGKPDLSMPVYFSVNDGPNGGRLESYEGTFYNLLDEPVVEGIVLLLRPKP